MKHLGEGKLMQSRTPVRRHTVLVLRDHDSVWGAEAQAEVWVAVEALHQGLRLAGYQVVPIQIKSAQDIPLALEPFDPGECVVFNWCEGVEPGANDLAQITALLDRLGYVYTGADTRALLTTQDKNFAKRVLVAHGIPTPAWQLVLGNSTQYWNRYPAIVKAATEHGSDGLTAQSVVYNVGGLRLHLAELGAQSSRSFIVSEFVDGREVTVALWGNDTIELLPLVEVDFHSCLPRIRTFEAKWEVTSPACQRSQLICPPHLSREIKSRIEQVALDTYRAFSLRDYGRIDIRLRDGVPYVIDVNPNPDITADSSFVIAAQEAGYNYSEMVDRIVRLAAQRAFDGRMQFRRQRSQVTSGQLPGDRSKT
jgi:D-alanine-D-alanine ligase